MKRFTRQAHLSLVLALRDTRVLIWQWRFNHVCAHWFTTLGMPTGSNHSYYVPLGEGLREWALEGAGRGHEGLWWENKAHLGVLGTQYHPVHAGTPSAKDTTKYILWTPETHHERNSSREARLV